MVDKSETDTEASEGVDAEDNLEIQIIKLKRIKNDLKHINHETPAVVKYDAKDIIEKLESDLYVEYDTTFLRDYINVLKSNNAVVIKQINNTIFSSIQQALRLHRNEKKQFEEAEVIVMAAWLSVAALCGARPAIATRTLRAVLADAQNEIIERIALMWQRTATAEMLLDLSDATRAAPEHASSVLADMLLRSALLAVTAAPRAKETECGPLRSDDVVLALDAAHEVEPLSELFRLAARVLMKKHSIKLLKSVERAAAAARARARASRQENGSRRAQVTTPITFHMLFGKRENLRSKVGNPSQRNLKNK